MRYTYKIYIYIFASPYVYSHHQSQSRIHFCGSAHFFLFPPPGLLNTADLLEKISQLQVGQLKMSAILYGVSLDFFSQPKAETLLFLKKVAEKSSADSNQGVGFCRNLWSFEFSLWKNLSCPQFTSGHISIKVQTLCRKPSLCTEELDVLVKRGEHIYAWIMTYSVAAFRRKHATHPACPCRRWFSWMKKPYPSKNFSEKQKPWSFSTDGLLKAKTWKRKVMPDIGFLYFIDCSWLFWFRSKLK